MNSKLTLENIEGTREVALNLCDNMILHLKSGISNDNIHILIGITTKMGNILDSIMEKIGSLTEKTELKKDTVDVDTTDVDTVLKSKGRFEVVGSAPPYSYYNNPL